MMYDPQSLRKKQELDFELLRRLLPECLSEQMRRDIRSQHHRAVIAATMAARFPGLAGEVSKLVDENRGDEAFDKIEVALWELHDADPALFAPIPDSEEMLKLALAARRETHLTDNVRAMLWTNHCESGEERRLADAYTFRRLIAAHGASKHTLSQDRTRDGGLIDGGAVAKAVVEGAT